MKKAYVPQNSWNGEVLIDLLVLILSTHKVNFSLVWHGWVRGAYLTAMIEWDEIEETTTLGICKEDDKGNEVVVVTTAEVGIWDPTKINGAEKYGIENGKVSDLDTAEAHERNVLVSETRAKYSFLRVINSILEKKHLEYKF